MTKSSAHKDRPKSILVVDDELTYLDVFSTIVGLVDNVACKTCDNGIDAMKLLKNEKFDAVFLDLVMPGIGGMQVLKEIQDQGIKSRIFVVSGYLNSELFAQCKQYGAHEVIEKPLDPAKVEFILKSVI